MKLPTINARVRGFPLMSMLFISILLQPQFASAGIAGYSATNTPTTITYTLNYMGNYTYRRVYIDVDQNQNTGFNTGQIGAEFLLENERLYQRPNIPAGNNWQWTLVKIVTHSNANGIARWTLARIDIGETVTPNGSDLIFQLESPLTSSAKATHVFSVEPTATTIASKTATPTATKTPTPTKTSTPTTTPSKTATLSPTSTSVPSLNTVSYGVDTTGLFPNPERGFYHHLETFNTAYQPLNETILRGYKSNENISLILRLWYLDGFQNQPISGDHLTKIQADFDTLRAAGLKAIVRFAYTNSDIQPYADASLKIITDQIKQLRPILTANADVIVTVQAGFIGVWGEWYYTGYFGSDGTITASQWTDRKAVHEALLSALPVTRTVQLRTPLFKTTFYGTSALTTADAFNSTPRSRTGHHNDCFLADATDFGTYTNAGTDKAYLSAENHYVPQGGETCTPSTYSQWPAADAEMRNLQYSYLNRDYHPSVLNSWGSNIDTVSRNLGYRINLITGTYSSQAKPSSEFEVNFSVVNTGYAAPFNPHTLFFVLRHQTTGQLFRVSLNEDVRRWSPSFSAFVARKICVPASMPIGNYDLFLQIVDPALPTRIDYAIRLANLNTWDSSTGFNRLLHTLTVNSSATNAPCSPSAVVLVGL